MFLTRDRIRNAKSKTDPLYNLIFYWLENQLKIALINIWKCFKILSQIIIK